MELEEQRRRQFIACAALAATGGIAGCSGNSTDDDSDDGDGDKSDSDETATPTPETSPGTGMSPGEVMRQMLLASAAGERETVRALTVEEYSLELVGEAEQVSIESLERYSPQEYADRVGTSVATVEEQLTKAEDRGYDDATIVSYTASTAEYDNIQRDYILVLDGDQWLVYDWGRLPQ
jgi:DNA-directed RNA polymerase specialized sigma24 family protein